MCTALVVALLFLRLNGLSVHAQQQDIRLAVKQAAPSNQSDVQVLADWLKASCVSADQVGSRGSVRAHLVARIQFRWCRPSWGASWFRTQRHKRSSRRRPARFPGARSVSPPRWMARRVSEFRGRRQRKRWPRGSAPIRRALSVTKLLDALTIRRVIGII